MSNDKLLHGYTFDHVFDHNSSQKEIFEIVGRPTVSSVFEGFNATIFAYGQTSSGKTFTMSGPNLKDASQKGLTPRIVSSIFKHIENSEETHEFMVKLSILEIYMENLRDLLDTNSQKKLTIKTDLDNGVNVENQTECYIGSEPEFQKQIRIGHQNRKCDRTNMNEFSSRSHLIVKITLKQNDTKKNICKSSKQYLVDLAGSERVSKTGAEGKILEESKNINKSLSCLGNVINSLFEKQQFVPYRDSKLTRVLQDSLGGNSITNLIITCSSASFNESDTLSTLRFGNRAKSILNKPIVNQEITIEQYKLFNSRLETKYTQLNKYSETLENCLKLNNIPESKWDVVDVIDFNSQDTVNTTKNNRNAIEQKVNLKDNVHPKKGYRGPSYGGSTTTEWGITHADAETTHMTRHSMVEGDFSAMGISYENQRHLKIHQKKFSDINVSTITGDDLNKTISQQHNMKTLEDDNHQKNDTIKKLEDKIFAKEEDYRNQLRRFGIVEETCAKQQLTIKDQQAQLQEQEVVRSSLQIQLDNTSALEISAMKTLEEINNYDQASMRKIVNRINGLIKDEDDHSMKMPSFAGGSLGIPEEVRNLERYMNLPTNVSEIVFECWENLSEGIEKSRQRMSDLKSTIKYLVSDVKKMFLTEIDEIKKGYEKAYKESEWNGLQAAAALDERVVEILLKFKNENDRLQKVLVEKEYDAKVTRCENVYGMPEIEDNVDFLSEKLQRLQKVMGKVSEELQNNNQMIAKSCLGYNQAGRKILDWKVLFFKG